MKTRIFVHFAVFSLLSCSVAIANSNLEELISAIETMESSIIDVNIEYQWRVIPPYTVEESRQELGVGSLSVKDGISKHKLYASGFSIKQGKRRLALDGPGMWLTEEISTVFLKENKTWTSKAIESFDGSNYKKLNISGWPELKQRGYISDSKSKQRPAFGLTPLGFSVLRTGFGKVYDNMPLSAILKDDGFTVFEPELQIINDFNTISVALLQEYTKQPVMRVYFSIDHGLTPVRFDYLNGAKPEKSKVILTFDVTSLEKVGDNLWFPSSGAIINPDEDRINIFETTKKISVNKRLAKNSFKLEFPKDTKVYNKIEDKTYTVK